jgi:hypothetical protein
MVLLKIQKDLVQEEIEPQLSQSLNMMRMMIWTLKLMRIGQVQYGNTQYLLPSQINLNLNITPTRFKH